MDNKKLEIRLEVRLYPDQLEKLKIEASNRGISVATIVREAIEQRYQVSLHKRPSISWPSQHPSF